jgi:hypothetical protein
MRILLTGASGNVGKGLVPRLVAAGHDLVLSDLDPLPEVGPSAGLPFHQIDVQHGFGLERAAEGCEMIIHTPAWHGVHWNQKTEADYWRLNVDGLFWAYQAARSNGITRFLFLSSQSWHGHFDKYGFTKRVGEELCEYHRVSNDISYVAVRPHDFTPWGADWLNRYGARLLYGGVDREDVLESIVLSAAWLIERSSNEGLVVDATRANAFEGEQVESWPAHPLDTSESRFPGSRALIEKYGINVARKPAVVTTEGWREIGYEPSKHFGTFIEELQTLDQRGGRAAVEGMICDLLSRIRPSQLGSL